MTAPTRFAKRVLLVGWEGADWRTIQSVISAEGLPNLAALLRCGAYGPLVASPPRIAETQWTSLITGQPAHKHCVLHPTQPLPRNRGTCRVMRPTIRTATLGAILSASGLTVHQVGWPVSHPAENLHGMTVSDQFASEARAESVNQSGGWPWVTPPSAAAELFARKCSPLDVDEVALAQLAPTSLVGPPASEHLRRICRLVLAETLTVFRSTKWCMDATRWDCTLCAFPALRRLRQAFEKLPLVHRSAEVEAAVLQGCYEYLDMLLGQLVASAGEEATIAVASMGLTGAVFPLFLLTGANIQSGPLPPRASVLDVTPTLLTMLGIPLGKDMDGRAWTNVMAQDGVSVTPQFVESWNACVYPPKDDVDVSRSASDGLVDPSVEHLLALGYVDPLETAAQEKAEQCRRESERNRALSLLDAGQETEAVALLRDLQAKDPLWTSPYELLAEAYVQQHRCDLAEKQLEFLVDHGAESARLYLLRGRLALAKRDAADALRHFHVAERITADLRGLQLAQATARLRRRDFQSAREAFQKSQEVDGPSAPALDGLATCSLGLGHYEQAADFALAALEQDMRCAKAHYHLGIALVRLGRLEDAQRVFETSAAVDPQFVAPLRWLARLSQDHMHDPQQAEAYRRRGREIIRRRRQPSGHSVDSA